MGKNWDESWGFWCWGTGGAGGKVYHPSRAAVFYSVGKTGEKKMGPMFEKGGGGFSGVGDRKSNNENRVQRGWGKKNRLKLQREKKNPRHPFGKNWGGPAWWKKNKTLNSEKLTQKGKDFR